MNILCFRIAGYSLVTFKYFCPSFKYFGDFKSFFQMEPFFKRPKFNFYFLVVIMDIFHTKNIISIYTNIFMPGMICSENIDFFKSYIYSQVKKSNQYILTLGHS